MKAAHGVHNRGDGDVGICKTRLDKNSGPSRVVALDDCVGALDKRQDTHDQHKLDVVDANEEPPAVHEEVQMELEVAAERHTPDEDAKQP